MSVEGTDYAVVSVNLVRTVIAIPDTIAVPDLGGGDIGSPTKTSLRSIHQPYYDSGGGDTGLFRQVQKFNDGIYERIRHSIRRV